MKRNDMLAPLMFILASLLVSNSLRAQTDRREAPGGIDKFFAKLPGPANPSELDRSILASMKSARVPGLAAAIVKNGKLFWNGSYGWANIQQKQRVTPETFFQVASISKTVTACVVMQLVEKGLLSLDADLDTILPFPLRNPQHAGTPITMKHLLTHTSGIKDNWNVLEDHWIKNGDFPEPLALSLAHYFKPAGKYYSLKKNYYKWKAGTRKQYSNVGFAVAAYVAEIVSKVRFEKLCQEKIFQPLGIQGSSFLLAGMDRSAIAMPYELKKKSGQLKALGHHGYLDYPAGTLRITAPQLARFLACFMADGQLSGTRVLRAQTVQEMRRIAFPEVAPKQGLAWYFSREAGHQVLGHDGGDPGVSTLMAYRPGDSVGVIILLNSEPKSGRFESSLAQRLFRYADQ